MPLLSLAGDMRLKNCKFRRWVDMLRLWNRLVNMDDTRITKAIFNHDFESKKKNDIMKLNQLCR